MNKITVNKIYLIVQLLKQKRKLSKYQNQKNKISNEIKAYDSLITNGGIDEYIKQLKQEVEEYEK